MDLIFGESDRHRFKDSDLSQQTQSAISVCFWSFKFSLGYVPFNMFLCYASARFLCFFGTKNSPTWFTSDYQERYKLQIIPSPFALAAGVFLFNDRLRRRSSFYSCSTIFLLPAQAAGVAGPLNMSVCQLVCADYCINMCYCCHPGSLSGFDLWSVWSNLLNFIKLKICGWERCWNCSCTNKRRNNGTLFLSHNFSFCSEIYLPLLLLCPSLFFFLVSNASKPG